MRTENIEFVRLCLDTLLVLDLSALRSSLHELLCNAYIPLETAVQMLRLLAYQLESHPEDIQPDWERKNDGGLRFMSLAAHSQRLSFFWPILRRLPYYASRTEPIPVRYVWQWDWEELGDAQAYFAVEEIK